MVLLMMKSEHNGRLGVYGGLNMAILSITGIKGLKRKIDYLASTPFLRTLMSEIGMFGMRAIKKRTLLGKEVEGIAFKPYSPQYAKQRAKEGFPIRPVDLSKTGSMLSAMTYDVGKNYVDIFFMNTTDPTGARNPAKAFYLNEDREFFALSEAETKKIQKIVNAYYKKALK